MLFVEPAFQQSSQTLSRLRDHLFRHEILPPSPTSIWGPCLHAGKCPLAQGRDWCHFSVRTDIPGRWFKQFSRALGSERHWLKFSYLWIASPSALAPIAAAHLRRVISDPLVEKKSRGTRTTTTRTGHTRTGKTHSKARLKNSSVLICEPEKPGRFPVTSESAILRGDLVKRWGPP